MPVALLMNVRMSRRLACVNRYSSGARDAGFRVGVALRPGVPRPAAAAMGGFGRDASMRSRMVRSSCTVLSMACVLPGSNSTVRRYSEQRGVELVLGLQLPRAVEVHARGVQHGALERDAVLGAISGLVLHRLPVVRDGRVPVANAARALRPC